MRYVSGILIMSALAIALSPTAPVLAQEGHDLYQQALRAENVQGDLQAAIELYWRVVRSSDRELAARALVRIGQSHERLGQAEAEEAYNLVIQDYADQEAQVEVARARLATLAQANVAALEAAARADGNIETSDLTLRRVWSADDLNIEGQVSHDGR